MRDKYSALSTFKKLVDKDLRELRDKIYIEYKEKVKPTDKKEDIRAFFDGYLEACMDFGAILRKRENDEIEIRDLRINDEVSVQDIGNYTDVVPDKEVPFKAVITQLTNYPTVWVRSLNTNYEYELYLPQIILKPEIKYLTDLEDLN